MVLWSNNMVLQHPLHLLLLLLPLPPLLLLNPPRHPLHPHYLPIIPLQLCILLFHPLPAVWFVWMWWYYFLYYLFVGNLTLAVAKVCCMLFYIVFFFKIKKCCINHSITIFILVRRKTESLIWMEENGRYARIKVRYTIIVSSFFKKPYHNLPITCHNHFTVGEDGA